jgi:hypothetical protein
MKMTRMLQMCNFFLTARRNVRKLKQHIHDHSKKILLIHPVVWGNFPKPVSKLSPFLDFKNFEHFQSGEFVEQF